MLHSGAADTLRHGRPHPGQPRGGPGPGLHDKERYIHGADGGMGRVGAEAHNSGPDPAVPYSYRPADAALAHGAGYQI